jgi:fructose-1,6-bisphosphatase/inositol monophosphatase family enzyme
MARFFDNVGYGIPGELVDGVWSDSITERAYYGDVLEVMTSNAESDKVNNDIRLQQRISIMADAFAFENFSRVKYVSWMGSLWTVISVRVERPRLILTLGGIYNGPEPPKAVQLPA